MISSRDIDRVHRHGVDHCVYCKMDKVELRITKGCALEIRGRRSRAGCSRLHFWGDLEEIIRENLDIGRPDMVQLIFNRRVKKRTPGRFRTRVLTDGVIPSLHVDYKNSRIKQYFKQVPGRA